MPIRTGLDIAEVSRVEALLSRYGDHFRSRFFLEPERTYARRGQQEAEQLAGLWAAKEAVFKALGHGYRWRSVVIHHQSNGRPRLELKPTVDLDRSPIPPRAEWDVTITHDAGIALASASCFWIDDSTSIPSREPGEPS